MTRAGAERAVVISALVIAATYAYRVVTEGQSTAPPAGAKQLVGVGAPPNIGRFVTGWGFSFLVISIITEAAPGFGAAIAILAASGDVLVNMGQVANDINAKVKAASPTQAANAAVKAGHLPPNPGGQPFKPLVPLNQLQGGH